jgi:Flp pilus assembly protein TadG
MKRRQRKQEGGRREKGQSLIEFALLVPVLLIILAGILDLGRLYFAYVAVTDAAGEGVAYAAIYPPSVSSYTCPTTPACTNPGDTDCICARALDASGGLIQIEGDKVEIECANCPNQGSGDTVSVAVTYDFELRTFVLNIIVPDGQLPLRAVATETILTGKVPGS